MCVSLTRALAQRGRAPLAAQAWKAMRTCPIGCLERALVSRTHFVPRNGLLGAYNAAQLP